MTKRPRRVRKDRPIRPPVAATVALERWLFVHGLSKTSLLVPLGASNKMVATRLFTGEALLSSGQRSALEEFTKGAITASMLAGKQMPPRPADIKDSPPTSPDSIAPRSLALVPEIVSNAKTPASMLDETAMRMGSEVIPGLIDGSLALAGLVNGVPPAKSEAIRMRAMEFLSDKFIGRDLARERSAVKEVPLQEIELETRLLDMESRLTYADHEFAEGDGM